MSITYTETKSDTDSRTEIDIGDGLMLNINISGEGIIMEVVADLPVHDQGAVVPIPKGEGVRTHLGTIGGPVDEWASWILEREDSE